MGFGRSQCVLHCYAIDVSLLLATGAVVVVVMMLGIVTDLTVKHDVLLLFVLFTFVTLFVFALLFS